MKTRIGFVSNSSSCSFSILSNHMTPKKLDHLKNHIAYANLKKWDCEYGRHDEGDTWKIEIYDDKIACETWMNNFDMHKFIIEVLMIPEDAIVDYYHS